MFESKLDIKPCRCGNDVFVKRNCWGKYIIGCSNMFCCDWLYNSEGYENKKTAIEAWEKKKV